MSAEPARIIRANPRAGTCVVLCPYCGRTERFVKCQPGQMERRVSRCSWRLRPDQRSAGITFQMPSERVEPEGSTPDRQRPRRRHQ